MNKLKKVGISALAGSLVTLSAAQAGGVSVTGNWELSYTSLDSGEVSGARLGMNKNISFGAGGDFTSGGGVTWATSVVMNDAMSGLSSASMSLNFGGIMDLAYDSGTGGWGANSVDNIVPTAWEEIDAGFSTGITDVGVVSKSKGVINMTVKAPGSGTALSISYVNRVGGDHVADGGSGGDTGGEWGADMYLDLWNASTKHFGWRTGVAAEFEYKDETCKTMKGDVGDHSPLDSCTNLDGVEAKFMDHPYAGTAYSSLRLGPFSVGAQATYKDGELAADSAVKNNYSWVGGAALTVGDYMSVSYGKGEDRYLYNNEERKRGAGQDKSVYAHFEGFSASINAGPVALKYFKNDADNIGGKKDTDKE
jgi:hypothetical protein